MNIIGSIIKTVIDVRGKISTQPDPVKDQQKVLKQLIKSARDTAFGKHFNFKGILEADNLYKGFKDSVPIYDYNSIYQQWWQRLMEGEPDITWPGKPAYFALTSGTTGKSSKRIPVTDDMLSAIQQAALKQIASLYTFDLPSSFFEKQIMMLVSSTDLKQQKGYLEGEISGISAGNIPFWFKGYSKPGQEISSIDDWDERIDKICEQAPEWDIGAISGIPSWIELMMKAVIKAHNLKNIHEIWPNLAVYTTGGVAFEPYRSSFEQQLDHPLIYIDTYLASEGFLAFQSRPETSAMQLVTDNGIYFEFVPFKEKHIDDNGSVVPDAAVLSIDEVEENKEYVILISTVAGVWRYSIGDTIIFTDKSRCEIKITGRTKHFLNVVGSQLSVAKMNNAMRHLEQTFNAAIPEFTVAAIRENGEFFHKWYLGSDTLSSNNNNISEVLDRFLMEVNKNYNVARNKALKGVKVEVVPTQLFYEWNDHEKKKGGQVKTPRVMKEEDFKNFEDFMNKIKGQREAALASSSTSSGDI
jgi:hypothetical protein